MKITKSELKKIILEETRNVLKEINFLSRSRKAMPVRSIGPAVTGDTDNDGIPDEVELAVIDRGELDVKGAAEEPGLGADKLREIQSYTCFQLEEFYRQIKEPSVEAFQTGKMSDEDYDNNVAAMMQVKKIMRKKGCFGA